MALTFGALAPALTSAQLDAASRSGRRGKRRRKKKRRRGGRRRGSRT